SAAWTSRRIPPHRRLWKPPEHFSLNLETLTPPSQAAASRFAWRRLFTTWPTIHRESSSGNWLGCRLTALWVISLPQPSRWRPRFWRAHHLSLRLTPSPCGVSFLGKPSI